MVARLALLLVLSVLVCAAPAAADVSPATFRVGVAAVPIDPHEPVCMGGYGCGTPTDRLHEGEHLYARALFIQHGDTAVALAKIDSQGWFAAYQEGPYGISDVRSEVAAAWKAHGLNVGPQNIVVSSTHSHAAPSIMGIWGKTDVAYLEEVHDAMVRALQTAREQARPATLTWARADAGFIDNVILGEANSNEGWPIDGAMPVLWARDARSGATIATYVNVPVHANIVYGPGDGGLLSADYPGVAERWLQARLGGTALVAMGTLGDQTSTMQVSSPGWTEIRHVGTLVGNLATSALAHGHPVTSGRLSAAEQYTTVPVTNPVLLALIDDKGALGQQVAGTSPVDRSDQPPYWLAQDVVGTYVTALRIGDLAYVSEPGEAFPQVHFAIEQATRGAAAVNVVGMAQDQLGYYFPSWAYPGTFYYSADHYLYNASPAMADQTVTTSLAALRGDGFGTLPVSPMAPGAYDYAQTARPSVQDMAFPRSGSAPFTSEVQCFTDPARLQSDIVGGLGQLGASAIPTFHPDMAPCTLDFGDGTPGFTGRYPAQATHTWAKPGTYRVKTAASDGDGNTTSWSVPVYVRAPMRARVALDRTDGGWVLRPGLDGGDGSLLAAHWTFADGTEAWGTRARVAGSDRPAGTVTVTDGDGETATTTFGGSR